MNALLYWKGLKLLCNGIVVGEVWNRGVQGVPSWRGWVPRREVEGTYGSKNDAKREVEKQFGIALT